MKIRKEYTCPLEIVHDFVKGKWNESNALLRMDISIGKRQYDIVKHRTQYRGHFAECGNRIYDRTGPIGYSGKKGNMHACVSLVLYPQKSG